MSFEDYLRKRLRSSLPGVDAHREFVPDIPDAEARLQPAPEGARNSAVLVPLISNPHTFPDVLLTVRSENLRSHKGQIAFPGGRVDEGETVVDAALREMHEETGVDPQSVQILGLLSPLYIPPSNSNVFPVVGIIQRPNEYLISETEVRDVFDVPLTVFLNEHSVTSHKRMMNGTEVDVPMWDVHPKVPLWGATAMILNELVWMGRDFISDSVPRSARNDTLQ